MTRSARITGIGSYLPEETITNADLERMVETSDEWIVSRTGIKERRITSEGETTSDLAARAARVALDVAGIADADVDQLIVATATPDRPFPATACFTQAKLGLSCPAYDINAVCSGFIYALQAGVTAIESGRANTVLVVGADVLSRSVDFTDRTTCVLFGDGAGAVVLQAADEPGVMSIVLGADGSGAEFLHVPAGGAETPLTAELIDAREQFIKMNGKEVFKFAVNILPKATLEALEADGRTVEDITWLVPHQANQRILDTVENRLGIAHEKVVSNVERVGNTSSASIPLALDELYTSGRLAPGDFVALVGFGAGLTWGAATVLWTMPSPDNGRTGF